jgi:hypothetical protein
LTDQSLVLGHGWTMVCSPHRKIGELGVLLI